MKQLLPALFLLLPFLSFSQEELPKDVEKRKAELRHLIELGGDDTTMFWHEMELGFLLKDSRKDSSVIHYKSALRFIKGSIYEKEHTPNILFKLAEAYYGLGELDSARVYIRKTEESTRDIKKKFYWFEAKNLEYRLLRRENKKAEAVQLLKKVIKDCDSLNMPGSKASALTSLARLHFTNGNYQRSLELSLEGLEIDKKVGGEERLATPYYNIASIADAMKDYKKAAHYFNKSLEISRKYNKVDEVSQCYAMLGATFGHLGKDEIAISYSDSAIQILKGKNNEYDLMYAYQEKMELLNLLKRYDEAIEIYDSLFTRVQALKDVRMERGFVRKRYYSHKGQKNYKEALRYFIQLKSLDDKINDTEFRASLAESETAYKTLKKEATIKEQQQKLELKEQEMAFNKKLTYSIVFALLVIGFTIYYAYKRKQEKEKLKLNFDLLELKHKALQLQLNPHFIFNAMATINAVLNKNKITTAKNSLHQLSKLMRGILSSSRTDLVSIDEEVELIKSFLELNKLVGLSEFSYEIELNEVDPEEFGVPPMLLQPILENAIKHGITPLEGRGHIKVEFQQEEDHIKISIEDNGVGRNSTKKSPHKGASVSTNIIQDRLNTLFGKENEPYKVVDLENPTGTRVELKVPLENMWD